MNVQKRIEDPWMISISETGSSYENVLQKYNLSILPDRFFRDI